MRPHIFQTDLVPLWRLLLHLLFKTLLDPPPVRLRRLNFPALRKKRERAGHPAQTSPVENGIHQMENVGLARTISFMSVKKATRCASSIGASPGWALWFRY